MEEKVSKTGRPKKELDYNLIENLAEIFCTHEEIASVLEVNVKTLTSREEFLEAYKRGFDKGKKSLRRAQMDCAKKGNSAMLIWLGKQYLGQSEKMAIVNSDIGDDELTKSIKAKMQQVKREMKQ